MRTRLIKKITNANQYKLSLRRKIELGFYTVLFMSFVATLTNFLVIVKAETFTTPPINNTKPFISQSVTGLEIIELTELQENSVDCVTSVNKLLNTYPNTPLKGRGKEMVAAVSKAAGKEDCEATKWLVAIACTESSCGRNHRNYNFVGLKGYNCKKVKCDKQGFEMFESFDQAIEIIAKRLYRPYLSKKDMDAYRGKYCQSACTHWETNVINFLSRM